MEEENDLLSGFEGDLLEGFSGSADFDNEQVPGESGQRELNHLTAVKAVQQYADRLYQSGEQNGLSAWFQRRKIGAANAVFSIAEDIAAVSELAANKLGFDDAAEGISNARQEIIRGREFNSAFIPTAFKGEAVTERVDAFLLDDGSISKNNVTGMGKVVSVEVNAEKGLLENVRDEDNLIIDVSSEAVKGFNESGLFKDYKRSLSVGQALTNSEQSIYDIGSMLLGAAPVKIAVKAGSKAAKRAVLTGYAGTAAGVQSFSDNYADALRKHGGDVDLAMNTATAKSAATGLLTVAIGKLDLDLIGGADLVTKKVTESAARFAAGEVTRKELVGGFLKEVTKGIAGETLEEVVDVVAGNMIERASGLDTDLLNNDQLLETVATSVFATAPFSAYNSTAKLSPTGILTQSAYSAAKDPIGFAELIDETIQEAGGVDAATLQEAEDKKDFIFELSNNLDLISDLGEDRQVELTSKLIQKRNLQKRLPTEETNLDPILSERTRIQLAQIDNDIIEIVEGRTAPIEGIASIRQAEEAPQVQQAEIAQNESVEISPNEANTEAQNVEDTVKQQTGERPVVEAEVVPTPKIERTNTGKANQLSIESLEDDLAVRLTEGMKLNQSDFDEAFDPNIRKDRGVALNKQLDSNNNSQQLDVLAQELGDKWGVDQAEARENIVRFMAEQKVSDYLDGRLRTQLDIEVNDTFSTEEIEAFEQSELDSSASFARDNTATLEDGSINEIADILGANYTLEDGSIDFDQLEADIEAFDNFDPEALDKLNLSGEAWATLVSFLNNNNPQLNNSINARNEQEQGTSQEGTSEAPPTEDAENEAAGTTNEGGTEPTTTKSRRSSTDSTGAITTNGSTTGTTANGSDTTNGSIKANNENFQEVRKQLLGDDLPESERKAFNETMAEAEQNHISSDLSKEVALSDKILQSDYIANDAEVVAIASAVGRVKESIKGKRSALSSAKKKRDKVAVNNLKTAIEAEQNQLDTLTRAGKKTGTQSARSLQIRSQVFDYNRYDRSAIEDSYRDASNDGSILHTDKRHASKLSNKIASKQAEIDDLEKKLQEERMGDLRNKSARVMREEVKADDTPDIKDAKEAVKQKKTRTTIKDAIVAIAKKRDFGAITDAISELRRDTPLEDTEVVEAMLLPPTDAFHNVESGSIRTTLSSIAKDNPLASQLLEALNKTGLSDTITLTNERKQGGVVFDTNKQKVTRFKINKDKIAESRFEQIFLHEMTHYLTMDLVHKFTNGQYDQLTSEQVQVLRELDSLRLAAIKAVGEQKVLELQTKFEAGQPLTRQEIDLIYPLINLDEFVAGAMTAKPLQDFLRSTDFKNSNIWDQFVDLIQRLLNTYIEAGDVSQKAINDVLTLASSERKQTTSTKSAELKAAAFPNEIRSELQQQEEALALSKKYQKQIAKVEAVLSEMIGAPNYNLPASSEFKAIADIVDTIQKLAVNQNLPTTNQSDFADLIGHLDSMEMLISTAYQSGNVEAKTAQLERAIESYNQVKAIMKGDSLDAQIQKQKEKIANLKSATPDLSFLERNGSSIFLSAKNKELLTKETELKQLKREVDARIKEIKHKAWAKEGFNLLGFDIKGDAATNFKSFLGRIRENAWELPRSLSFCADIGHYTYQMFPFTVATISGANISFKDLAKGNYRDAFQNQRLLMESVRDGFFGILLDDLSNIGSKTPGLFASQKYKELQASPYFEAAKASGLQLSESGSINNSEEVFTSSLIHKIPVLGQVVGTSERMMVTTLNHIRYSMFEQAAKAYPTADRQQLEKIAGHINTLTGTTNDNREITSALSFFLSAPKLIYSKAKIIAAVPKALNRKDDAAKFMSDRIGQMMAGQFLVLYIASLRGMEFCDDPRDSCFGRLLGDGVQVDFNGGIGPFARSFSTAAILAAGPEAANSFLEALGYEPESKAQKQRRDQKAFRGATPISELIKTFVNYKIHPFISTASQVATGKNFFNRYHPEGLGVLDPKDPIDSRVESLIRGLTPITVSTIFDAMNDPQMEKETKTAISMLSFLGVSSFAYFDKLSTPSAKNYFERIDKGDYKIVYPGTIKDITDRGSRDYMKAIYKQEIRDYLGNFLEAANYELDPDTWKALKKKDSKEIQAFNDAFMEKYELN